MAKFNPLGPVWRAIRHIHLRILARGLRNIGMRLYALALLLVLLWAGYLAVHYLILTVFYPVRVPQRFVEWQARLDTSALRAQNAPGVTELATRAPLAHFHRVDRWFQPDPANACTAAGCHESLPHTKRAGVAAFTNFHASFLTCQMCHQAAAGKPVAAGWVNLGSGRFQEVTAILQLLKYFEENAQKLKDDPAAAHAAVAPLLDGTIKAIGGDRVLEDLLLLLQTSEPGSPVWKHAIEQLAADLPMHARGEYGAKLARRDPDGLLSTDQIRKETRIYFAAPDVGERGRISQRIHVGVLKQPDACVTCHTDQSPLVDFTAAGYSPKRSTYLRSIPLARMVQQLRQGGTFYLPSLLEPTTEENK